MLSDRYFYVISSSVENGYFMVHHPGEADFVAWALSGPERLLLVGDEELREIFLSDYPAVPPSRVVTPVEVPAILELSTDPSSVELAVIDPIEALTGALRLIPQGGYQAYPLFNLGSGPDGEIHCLICGDLVEGSGPDQTVYCDYCFDSTNCPDCDCDGYDCYHHTRSV